MKSFDNRFEYMTDHYVIGSRFTERAISWLQKNVNDPNLEPNGAKNVEAEMMKNWRLQSSFT